MTKAHQRGMEVWGLIDNFSADISTEKVLASSSARAKIVKQLMTSAKRTGLDGINVDFESMTEEAVPHFLEFLRAGTDALSGQSAAAELYEVL